MAKTLRPFTMVRRSLWGSERFTGLPDDSCRYLYLYLLTCPHQTSVGCVAAKEAYILADLTMPGADWSQRSFREAVSQLQEAGLVHTDPATGEILIARWWQDNGPNNDSWFMGAQKQLEGIKSPTLKAKAQEALEARRQAPVDALFQRRQFARRVQS